MKKKLSFLTVLLIAGMALAQNGGNIMKKYENQLPQEGRGNVHVAYNDSMICTYESLYSVVETMARIEQTLKIMGIPVFAKFDHGRNAEEVGLKLLPNQVIVFGSPKVGTALMQENPSISIELPLKISVWEDKNGSVWATFPQMRKMATNYGMENNPVIGKMQELLENIVIKSAT